MNKERDSELKELFPAYTSFEEDLEELRKSEVDRGKIKQASKSEVAEIRQSERDRRNRIENDDKEQTVQLKKGICRWVQWVVTLYLAFVSCLILAVAWEQLALNDAVIITLLSTTTINILALPYIIINSLFPK